MAIKNAEMNAWEETFLFCVVIFHFKIYIPRLPHGSSTSGPPLGVHRAILFTPFQTPRATPYFFIARIVYSEHVG